MTLHLAAFRWPPWGHRTRSSAAWPSRWEATVEGLMATWQARTGDRSAAIDFRQTLRQAWQQAMTEGNQDAPAAPLALLGDTSPERRAVGCLMVGMLGVSRSLELMLTRLGDDAWLVREAAWRVLVAKGGAAVAPIVQGLEDPSPLVREAACRALGALQAFEATDALGARLTDDAWMVREAACAALGQLPGTAARRALESAVDDPDPSVRRTACRLLAAYPKAASTLRQALSDGDASVRLAACESLAQGASAPSMVAACAPLAADPVPAVRAGAVRAIARHSESAAQPLLVRALADPATRLAACQGLAACPSPEALPGLVAGLADPRPAVRVAAGAALTAGGEGRLAEAVLGVLRGAKDALPVLERLARSGDTRWRTPLLARLCDPDATLRRRAYWALGRLARPSDTDALLHGLRDPDWRVAWGARAGLHRLEAQQAPTYRSRVCRAHLTRFEIRHRWSRVGRVGYYGCRACGEPDDAFEDVETLLAVLDETMRAPWLQTHSGLRVNALGQSAPFDFDRVDLVEAAPAVVERFCIAVANDTDARRRLRQKPCFIADTLSLPANTERVLRTTFYDVRRVRMAEQQRA